MRDRIQAAARELYRAGGIEAVTMRAVASQADMAPSALYSYFDNRRSLIESLWLEPVAAALAVMESKANSVEEPVARIEAILSDYIAFALENPDIYTGALMHVRPVTEAPPVAQPLEGLPLYRILKKAIAEAQTLGVVRPGSPGLAAQALWASVHGALALPVNMEGWRIASRADLARQVVANSLSGLLTR